MGTEDTQRLILRKSKLKKAAGKPAAFQEFE
jgi:hypothetical protein